MCGVCGLVDTSQGPEQLESRAREMLYAILHRGPDDCGVHLDFGVGLGHARLSIQDLSVAGHQPMLSKDRRYAVVFNGEIYNFHDLRGELEQYGYVHHSRSDTEVLLHSYMQWGEECLDRLNGMFAFAIWDSRERRLFVARDRLGIKPLYYTRQGDRFAFSSEIKSILRLPWVRRSLCLKSAGRFLQLRYNDGDQTLFENIFKLPPAHKLVLDGKGMSISRYWRMIVPEKFEKRSIGDWLDELCERLERSVREHIISDVPVGVFLSGGVDSNTVMSLATKFNNVPPNTFSVGFSTEKGRDELGNIRESKSHFGSKHHELILKPHIEGLLAKTTWASDEPLADPALIPTYLLCEMAAKKVKVVLSGEGGDELFGGYERSMLMYYGRRFLRRVPDTLCQLAVSALRKAPRHLLDKFFKYSSRLGDKGFDRLMEFIQVMDSPCASYIMSNAVFTDGEMCEMLASDAQEAIGGLLAPAPCNSMYYDGMNETGFLNYALRFEMETRLWADLLMKLDSASMPFGLEGRVPYLDHRLVELSMQIPPKLKIRFGKEKWILREASKAYLPESICRRKKEHFFVPIDTWLRDDLREFVCDKLDPGFLKEQGLFNPQYIKDVYDNYMGGALVYARQLWNLVCFQTWYDVYLENRYGWLSEKASEEFAPPVTYAHTPESS